MIDNLTVKEFLKDRTNRFFKLITSLFHVKNENNNFDKIILIEEIDIVKTNIDCATEYIYSENLTDIRKNAWSNKK